MSKTNTAQVPKVQTYSNWCEIDCYGRPELNGNKLLNDIRNGDKVRVHWPDGSKDEYRVRVVSRSEGISDMGSQYNLPISEAFIHEQVHGHSVMVRLLGLRVEKIDG